MANSKVALANIALDRIGAKTILSFDDDSKSANVVKRAYPEARREVLRSHLWNSCRRRVVLSPLVDTPAFEYSYAFTIPSDCLRILPYGTLKGLEYDIEGREILANESLIQMKYISDVDDPNFYDQLLTKAISEKLAANIAYKLTQSSSVEDSAEQRYERILRRAKTINAQEQQDQNLESEEWLNSRLIST